MPVTTKSSQARERGAAVPLRLFDCVFVLQIELRIAGPGPARNVSITQMLPGLRAQVIFKCALRIGRIVHVLIINLLQDLQEAASVGGKKVSATQRENNCGHMSSFV